MHFIKPQNFVDYLVHIPVRRVSWHDVGKRGNPLGEAEDLQPISNFRSESLDEGQGRAVDPGDV